MCARKLLSSYEPKDVMGWSLACVDFIQLEIGSADTIDFYILHTEILI